MGSKRRVAYGAAALSAALLLSWSVPLYGAEGGCEIEQISIHMPEIKVYYRAEEPENAYEAYLGGRALSYEDTETFKKTGEGADYYFLLDVSASISKEQFAGLKDGLCQFIESKGANDRCMLLTFGNESKVILDGSETVEGAVQTIGALENNDMETVLFQTIVQTAGMIEKAAQNEEKRRVIVALTDGEDCVTGQATALEAQQTLLDKGIPLYAAAVDVGKEEFLNSFGEFARNTGGTLNIFEEDSFRTLKKIRKTVNNSYVAAFRNATNVASNQREDFTVKFLEHQATETREVIPTRWTPDTTAPVAEAFEKQGDNELVITFSEPVLGADVQSNYKVEKDEESVAIGSVFYEEGEKCQAVLTFEKPLYTGAYQVYFNNITDHSMEKNLLPDGEAFSLEGAEPEDELSFWEKWWGVILAAALAVLGTITAVFAVNMRKIKKNKGILYVDGKATLASNVDVKQHVSVKQLPQKNIRLLIRDKTNGSCEMKMTIHGSAMAGRSDSCDIYFDDMKMSRQHFALETDGTDVYITDLESQNGTLVNGVAIQKKRKLSSGDEITAGNIEARILW